MEEIILELKNQNEEYDSNFKTVLYLFITEQLSKRFEEISLELQEKSRVLTATLLEKESLETYFTTQINKFQELLCQSKPTTESLKEEELARVKLSAFHDSRTELESKWENLKKDLQYYREEYYKLNNFTQQECIKYELQTRIANEEFEQIKNFHSIEAENLRAQIIELNSIIDISHKENYGLITREKQELEFKVKNLLDENSEIRSQNEGLVLEKIQLERVLKKQNSEVSSIAKGLQGENSSLRTKIMNLENQNQDLKKEKQEILEKNSKISQELSSLKSRHDQTCHEFKTQMTQLKGLSIQEKSKDEAIIKEQEYNISKLKQTLANSNEIIAGLKLELIDLEKDANNRIKTAREEEMSKIVSVEFEKKNLQQEISCFNIKISDLEHQYSLVKKELENEIMSLKESVRNLMIEKDSLASQNVSLSADREKFLKDLSTVSANYQSLRDKFDAQSQESENYKNQVGSLSERVSALQIHQNHLKDVNFSSLESLKKEKEAFDHQMERVKAQFIQERMEYKNVLKDYSNEIYNLTEKNQKIKDTMEMQKQAYLSKVSELKKKLKRFESDLEIQKNTTESQANELQEIKSKQSNFLQFLQTEMTNPIA